MKTKKTSIALIAGVALLMLLKGCTSDTATTPNDKDVVYSFDNTYHTPKMGHSVHVSIGIPYDKDSSDDYRINRSTYYVSYNPTLNVANYVSYELNADWYGDVPRYPSFITDTTLPQTMYRVKHEDYTNSGYDRSHLVASEERTRTVEENKSTFLFTNIIPQKPDVNQGVWNSMERWCETMCKDSSAQLYVIAGGVYTTKSKIKDVVTIPDSCFKIVVVLKKGEGLSSITKSTRIEAVMIPNKDGVRKDTWSTYKRSVDEIEQTTGYNFLDYVPSEIQKEIEAKK